MSRLLTVALCALTTVPGTAHAVSGIYAKKELRVRVTRKSAPQAPLEQSTTQVQSWRAPPLERSEHSGSGPMAQLGTLLYDERDGSTWMLDDDKQRAARVAPPDGNVAVAMLGADYGLDFTGSGPATYAFVALGDSEELFGVRAQHQLLKTESKSVRVEVWIAPGLPLSSKDWGAALRRRVGKHPPAAVERFIAAWEKLPGYPVRIVTAAQTDAATVTTENVLVEVRRADISADRLAVPAGYGRLASADALLVGRLMSQEKAKDTAWNREQGFDRPFAPTRAQPLPPALGGGSCRHPAPEGDCLEWASDDSTTQESCIDAEYSTGPCDRSAVLGVCVYVFPGHITYRYLPAVERRWVDPRRYVKEACDSDGRFYEKPGAMAEAETRARAFVARGGAFHCEMPARVCLDLFTTSADEAKSRCSPQAAEAGPCPDRGWDGACWEDRRLLRYRVGIDGKHWCSPETRATSAERTPRPASDAPGSRDAGVPF